MNGKQVAVFIGSVLGVLFWIGVVILCLVIVGVIELFVGEWFGWFLMGCLIVVHAYNEARKA